MTVRDHPRSGDLAGAALILLAAACFGTLGPLSRFADEAGVSSLTLVTWRAVLGAACMAGFLALRAAAGGAGIVRLSTVPVRDRWFMAAAAVANTILNLSVFIAFLRISIALSLLVFYLYPAFVALVSVIWLGERLDRIRWVALGLSLAGMVLVVAGAGTLGQLDALGLGLSLLGALGQTFYVLAARHGFAHVPGAQAAGLTMAGAAGLYLLVAVATGSLGALAAPLAGWDALLPVILAGVLGAGIPTVSYILGIRRLGAPRAAILANFEPVVGVALAAILLAERPTLVQLAGGLLIIVAGVVLQLRPRADTGEHEAVAGTDPADVRGTPLAAAGHQGGVDRPGRRGRLLDRHLRPHHPHPALVEAPRAMRRNGQHLGHVHRPANQADPGDALRARDGQHQPAGKAAAGGDAARGPRPDLGLRLGLVGRFGLAFLRLGLVVLGVL
ncbi:MAG: DMT family transporter, partial [Candidatus Limnocylindria bacterium]